MEGDALKKELARVRDGAADLLQQLTADAPAVAPEQTARRASGQKKSRTQWRHRRRTREETSPAPMPTDPGSNRADSQAAKMRDAKTMVKTSRRRGRG
jgi:hypothetical protein